PPGRSNPAGPGRNRTADPVGPALPVRARPDRPLLDLAPGRANSGPIARDRLERTCTHPLDSGESVIDGSKDVCLDRTMFHVKLLELARLFHVEPGTHHYRLTVKGLIFTALVPSGSPRAKGSLPFRI